ncbi:MAG: carcinine hydrolase/isopenicillin-N N-acyltransferase family protein [Thermincolia bacterium]
MFEKENLFELWSQKTIKAKKPVILVTNQLHEEESYYYYGFHHPHFVILNGYNESTGIYYIIDEDYSLNQTKQRWKNGSFLYINREIGLDKLKQLCLDSMNSFYIASLYSNLPAFSGEYLHTLEIHTKNLNSNYFSYQYPIVNSTVTSCNIEDIGKMYIDYLQQMLKDLDGLYGVIIDNLKTFKDSIVSLRELLKIEDTGIVSPSVFEYSEYKLGKHDFSLQALIEVIRTVSGNSLHDSLDGVFRAVREKYSFLQKLFFKALISGEPALVDKLMNSLRMHVIWKNSDKLKIREVNKNLFPDSETRYKIANSFLNSLEDVQIEDIIQLFTTHVDSEYNICHHLEDINYKYGIATLFTVIMELKEMKMYLSLGTPCDSEFFELDLNRVFNERQEK